MQGSEKRRDRRYPTNVPALITQGKRSIEARIENVCFRGAFLRTSDKPPAARQLVRIELEPDRRSLTCCLLRAIDRRRSRKGAPLSASSLGLAG